MRDAVVIVDLRDYLNLKNWMRHIEFVISKTVKLTRIDRIFLVFIIIELIFMNFNYNWINLYELHNKGAIVGSPTLLASIMRVCFIHLQPTVHNANSFQNGI